MTAGYSQTPLAKKLGIKAGFKIKLVNEPAHYCNLLTDLPDIVAGSRGKKDFIHFFSTSLAEVNKVLPKLKNEIVPGGMIWVSWPKKASGIVTDVTEDRIRDIGLSCGLVDIKVCAVDEIWSGLKFVIPVKDRP